MPSLVESIVKLDVGAQEPWPNDVKLYQPYAMEQILLPDNANCLAVQAFLHMCGLPFQIEHRANAEFMSPSGKVPFIKCGAFVVSELEPIVQFVANKGITLTEELSADQKSDMRAYMSIIYTVLMNAELYICWCDKRTYNEVTKVRNGSVYPWPLNHFQTWSKRSAVNRKLKVLSWYQKSLESVYQEVENCCQALSERLDGKEYFFGSKPTQVDAYIYGHIFAILSSPEYSSELITIVMKYPNLVSHCRRICKNYVYNTSLHFSELLEPTKSASKLIMNKKTCSYELKSSNQVTTITRYLKFLNSDSDVSELTNSSSRETCKSSFENIKRTSSLTDCSIFDTEQLIKKKLSTTNEQYQNLSQSDHDYLTNLFCADKPPETEVKFVKLKSKELSDSSSEDSVKQSKKKQKIFLKSSNKNKTSIPRIKFGTQEKKNSNTYLITNDDKEISNISLPSKKSEILKKKESKTSLATVNEKVTDTSSPTEEVGFIEKNVSEKYVTFVTENKKLSDISLSSAVSRKQEKKVHKKSLTIVNEKASNALSTEEPDLQENDGSKKSVTFVTENIKDSHTLSGKQEKTNSKKSLTTVNEMKQSSYTTFSSLDSVKLENNSFKSLISGNEEEKYLDVYVSSEDPEKKLSKNSITFINEDKKSSDIPIELPGKKVSKKSLASLSIDEKYLDISISSEESGKKVSKKSMTIVIDDKQISNISFHETDQLEKKVSRKYMENIRNDEKELDVSLSNEEPGKKVSKKSLTIASEDKKKSNISFCNQELEMQGKKVSRKSLTSVDEKYLDVSLSSQESGNKVSKNSLTIATEDKKKSNTSLASIYEKYLGLSISSEGSGNKVSKKSLTIVNDDKKKSNISILQESGPHGKKVSKKSLFSLLVDERYLDISLSSESGNNVSKKSLAVLNEDKKKSNISMFSQESVMQGKKVSHKSLASLSIDERYLDISLSSEGSESKISKKSLIIANEDKKKSVISIFNPQSKNQGKKVSRKSLTSIDEKYLDVSLSSEGSANKISRKSLTSEDLDISTSQKSLSVIIEDSQISNTALSSDESEKQDKKVSKKSSNEEDERNDLDHAYSDISLSSF